MQENKGDRFLVYMFKWFTSLSSFNNKLENNEIERNDISFIKETKQIYTHDTFFGGENGGGM